MGSRFIEIEKVCNLMCKSNTEGHGVISKRCDNFYMCVWGKGEIFFTLPFLEEPPLSGNPPFQIAEPETSPLSGNPPFQIAEPETSLSPILKL